MLKTSKKKLFNLFKLQAKIYQNVGKISSQNDL